MKYHVDREHHGDRFYRTGDTREAEALDVAHLVRAGVLSEMVDGAGKDAVKAAAVVANKASPRVANKAAQTSAGKALGSGEDAG